jgi:peptidoglycan/xylan/chitin deacetylase (PgdA/CDA1 family)
MRRLGWGYGISRAGRKSGSRYWTPQIPSELVSVIYNSTQVDLTGTYSGIGEDGFKWERSVDNGATYSEIGTSGSGVKTYSDTNASTRNKYMYRFRAYKGTKYSDYSPISTIDTTEWLTYWQTKIAAILNTTNCLARFDYTDLTTLTKDGSTQKVSRWNDKLGTGHDLIQNTGGYQPVWSNRGVLVNIVNFMKCASFTFTQPEEIYILTKLVSVPLNGSLFDGNGSNSGVVGNFSGAGYVTLQGYAGSFSADNVDGVRGQWSVIRVLFNGASSELQIDDNAPIVFNCGASNMSGFTLGARQDGANPSSQEVKDILVTKGGFSAPNKTIINEYLKIRKYIGNVVETKLISPALSLTFDDYPTSSGYWYTNGYATIQAKGVKVNAIVPTVWWNTATKNAMVQMFNDGHEILNHSDQHQDLSTLTAVQIETDINNANAIITGWGITLPVDFAIPIGGYVLAGDKLDVIKAHFNSCRNYYAVPNQYQDDANFIWHNTDKYNLPSVNWSDQLIQEVLYKRILDYAKFMKCGIILTCHGVQASAGNSWITVTWLGNLIDYANSIGLNIVKMSQLVALIDHI